MRAKDLSVGMCVAVKSGMRIKKAWVLEVGTRWYWELLGGWRQHSQPDTKAVALVIEHALFDDLDRDVVKLSRILSTWDEYAATQKKNQEAAQRAYERARRREREFQERFDKLNLSDAQLEANGYVRISLDALEALSRRQVDDGEDRQ